MKNPFIYGKPVTNNDFCHRVALEEKLERILKEDKKVYLTGKHKMGKTSLVKEVAQKFSKTHYLVHIDLKFCESLENVEGKVLESLLKAESEYRPHKEVLKYFASYQPSMGFDELTSEVSFSLLKKSEGSLDSLKKSLDLLRPQGTLIPLVFIDNLQELPAGKDSLKIFLDKAFNNQEASFIFCESIDLFKEKSEHQEAFSGLYQEVALEAFEESVYFEFVKKKMLTKGLELSESVFKEILALAGDVSGDRQLFLATLWEILEENQVIDSLSLKQTLRENFERYQDLYLAIFEDLTILQKRVLKLLASDKEAKVYSRAFSDKVGPTAGNTVTKVLLALTNRRLIYKEGSNYRFLNPFFKEWIKKYFPVNS